MSADLLSPVIRRVKKLLDLAARAGSEAEAATAAEHAARLLRENQLSEAEVRAAHAATSSPPAEPIVRDFVVPAEQRKRKSAWRGWILHAVAKRFGCYSWYRGGEMRLFGRESAVQAASYTTLYLWTEIDGLADRGWKNADQFETTRWQDLDTGEKFVKTTKRNTRAWKNSFCMGAANTIYGRLMELAAPAKPRRPAPAKPAPVAVLDERDIKPDNAPDTHVSTPSHLALALVEKDQDEVDADYAAFSAKFKKKRSSGRATSGEGYTAGEAAGRKVSLGSDPRRGLAKAPGKIEK